MKTNKSSVDSGFLFGLLVGVAAGTAVTLLYAPWSGRDTRDYLGDRAREGRDLAGAAIETGRDVITESREVIDRGRDALSTAIAEGRDAYRQTKASDIA